MERCLRRCRRPHRAAESTVSIKVEDHGWKRKAGNAGTYVRTDGKCDALVRIDGEIWRSFVYYDGELVDQGEWDGRGAAFRNARGAMKRAFVLRAPCNAEAEREELDDEQ